jgi:glutaredoxin
VLRRRARPREVVLVTRVGCHLCEQAAPVVAREAARAGAAYVERDVDASEQDRAAYGEKVPVVLLDGVEHAYWQVDAKALRAALRG